MTSLSLEEFLLRPVRHIGHLAAFIEHLLACPISDVAGDHVTDLRRISTGLYNNVHSSVFSELLIQCIT